MKTRTAWVHWASLPELQVSLMAGSGLIATLLIVLTLKAAGPVKTWLLDVLAYVAILLGRAIPGRRRHLGEIETQQLDDNLEDESQSPTVNS
jgi:hypothetical protein